MDNLNNEILVTLKDNTVFMDWLQEKYYDNESWEKSYLEDLFEDIQYTGNAIIDHVIDLIDFESIADELHDYVKEG